ncbi:MAG: MBL fold metallo-hydrolase, partial [Calditrichota bacterium]
MLNHILILFIAANGFTAFSNGQPRFETDTIPTNIGNLKITFIGHGTLMFEFGGVVIHIDPVSQYADYAK